MLKVIVNYLTYLFILFVYFQDVIFLSVNV